MRLDRRSFLKLTASAMLPYAAAETAQRPNVVIILTDDQGYGDLSCHGNPVLKTPNLDRLHSESVRFTDFHVAPMCTPTRGQLLTGQDAFRNGATSVTAGRAMIRPGIPTMADVLKRGGYATGIFGKWHVGDHYPYRPMDRGFDEAVYHLGFGMSSAPEFDNDYFNGRYHHNGAVKQFEGYCTDFWFNQAMAWVGKQQQRKQPFLCYLPTNTPHGPAWVAEKYSAPYRKPGLPADYYGMIANLDENIGRLDRFLDESGLKENTLVIFMTDNGATAGYQIYNAGMRGRKTEIYDGGHRVPCFVRWPGGRLRKPGDIGTAAQIQDIFPTVLELTGVRPRSGLRLDGRSLAGLLRGEPTLPDRMFVVQYNQIPVKWDSCVVWGKWRLVRGEELYNLQEDPGQKKDIAAGRRDVVKQMRDHYEAWWAGVEPGLTDYAPISLGAEQANPVYLTCSDWLDVYADNPRHVSEAAGGPRGGPWNVTVERSGTYEITLSRWPLHLNMPLTAGREPQKMTAGSLPPGKAVPIARAQLAAGGLRASLETKPQDTRAVFRVRLEKGPRTQLHGWFQDKEGNDVCGAFYASVRRV